MIVFHVTRELLDICTFVSLWSTGNPRKQLQPIVGASVRFGWLAIVLGGIFHENMFYVSNVESLRLSKFV